MKYQIWFSPTSRAEILEAFEFIRGDRQAPLNAARWLDSMIEAIESLAEAPHSHALARKNGEFEEELRQHVFKSHRIIFDVAGNMVRIHRVVHVARKNLGTDEINGPTRKS